MTNFLLGQFGDQVSVWLRETLLVSFLLADLHDRRTVIISVTRYLPARHHRNGRRNRRKCCRTCAELWA